MSIGIPKNILVAPLDWGLGHTSRCIPLIRHIMALGHRPIFAGNQSQQSFVKQEFPELLTLRLQGYDIRYSPLNRLAQLGLLAQLPSVYAAVKAEHKWLNRVVREHDIHGIISDNRYGLHHAQVPSVIITHQLQVLSGSLLGGDNMLRNIHYNLLRPFGAAWVPDMADDKGLAGKLSHPAQLPPNCRYIGLLSRFAGMTGHEPEEERLLVLLSGPEPQRSAISGKLWLQAESYKGAVDFVEGTIDVTQPVHIPAHITWHFRLGHNGLLPRLQSASTVICRSGYSTLMDLAALGKKAILIPTPGQTEQEYLGKQLHGQGIFYCAQQAGFNLSRALDASADFHGQTNITAGDFGLHRPVLEDWISKL